MESIIDLLTGSLRAIGEQRRKIKRSLIIALLALPDNPVITRLGDPKKGPRCYTIQFSDIGDNWTPKFHDFKLQHQIIIRLIAKAPSIEKLYDLVGLLVTNGMIPDRSEGSSIVTKGPFKGKRGYKLHPDVVKQLREATGFAGKTEG